MGLFTEALERRQARTESDKGRTVWLAEGEPAAALTDLARLNAEAKAIAAQMDRHKTVVRRYAEEQYLETLCADGKVAAPMSVQNAGGDRAGYVVQDRSASAAVNPVQRQCLEDLLGTDAAGKILYEELVVSLDRELLARPGVAAIVEKHLERAILELTAHARKKTARLLSDEEAAELVKVERRTAFVPGLFARLTDVVGRDVGRLKLFLDAAGAALVRYVRV